MLSYCLKYLKKTESKNSMFVRSENGRIIILPKCEVCSRKKSKFSKKQEASGLLSSLVIRTCLNFIRSSFVSKV